MLQYGKDDNRSETWEDPQQLSALQGPASFNVGSGEGQLRATDYEPLFTVDHCRFGSKSSHRCL